MEVIPLFWILKMNASKSFYIVELVFSQIQFKSFKELVDLIAVLECHSSGTEEINIDEKTVNILLKEKAVGGGELPEEAISEVESFFNNQKEVKLKYFFEGDDAQENAQKFAAFLKENIALKVKTIKGKNLDWNAEWKRHYKTIEVGPKLKVVPSWEMSKLDDHKNHIYIYPGMGFGTGGHETTHMCLQAMIDLFKVNNVKGKRCLDFGCGSGILGIGAMKMGEMSLDFCDIDKSALDNCYKNLILNFSPEELVNASNQNKKETGLILRDRFAPNISYSLIFANILENIILEEYHLLQQLVEMGGHIIVSGILINQIPSILQRFVKNGTFKKVQEYKKGDWAAIVLKKI